MKRVYSQKELIELLESNPLKKKVYFNEVTVPNASNYIFLDTIQDISLTHDDTATYINQVQIQIYDESIDDLNKTLRFIKDNFICDVERYKEDDYNVANCTTQLIVSDW